MDAPNVKSIWEIDFMVEPSHFYSVQIIGGIFGLFLIISMFFLVKSKMVQEKHSLVWIFIGALILVFSIFRDLMEVFSDFIGIYYAPSALFAILIACAYILLLNMSISISTLKKKTKTLIQESALLKLKIEELEKRLEEREKV